MMHPKYLPFTKEQLISHFTDIKQKGECRKNEEHLSYYQNSIERYNEYFFKNPDRNNRRGKPLTDLRTPCQIEKDERFWIASSMMTIFYDESRIKQYETLFTIAYGNNPPVRGLSSWRECFEGDLHLFFEPNLPSPDSYKKWLRNHIEERQIIPYILDSAAGKENLEGATNVDAMLLNSNNGFAVLTEAKVLSDISYMVTYDAKRNQAARNIDVMLDKNDDLCFPLNKRDPGKTLFLLVTPETFKKNPTSRMYGYKFHEYKNNPQSLSLDLPHRDCDWQDISKRIGWLTWEDLNNVNRNCCPWLKDTGNNNPM